MSKLTLTLATIALLGLPSIAAAEGCNWQHMNETASQCTEGQVLDPATGTCVANTTS